MVCSIIAAKAMLIEADRLCILAIVVVAVGCGARGRFIAVHEPVADRRTIYGAVVGLAIIDIAACFIHVAVLKGGMIPFLQTLPLGGRVGIGGVPGVFAIDVKGLPVALEAEGVSFRLRRHCGRGSHPTRGGFKGSLGNLSGDERR
jgi:hypothetical protein